MEDLFNANTLLFIMCIFWARKTVSISS